MPKYWIAYWSPFENEWQITNKSNGKMFKIKSPIRCRVCLYFEFHSCGMYRICWVLSSFGHKLAENWTGMLNRFLIQLHFIRMNCIIYYWTRPFVLVLLLLLQTAQIHHESNLIWWKAIFYSVMRLLTYQWTFLLVKFP